MGPTYHHPNFIKGEIRKVEITPKLAQLRRETLIKPKWLHLRVFVIYKCTYTVPIKNLSRKVVVTCNVVTLIVAQ